MPMRSVVYRAVQCVLIVVMVWSGVSVAFPQTANDVKVELFYDNVWNVITTDVLLRDGMTITRGRGDEAARCDPGRATFTINNRSGKYSPRNPTSVLYGKIGRNTPVRISVTYNAVTYTRFVGEVSAWPSRWDMSQKDVWVPIEAYGILRRLGQGASPLHSAMRLTIMADNPVEYWKLEDGEDSTRGASALANNTNAMLPTATVQWAAIAGAPGMGGSAAQVTAGTLNAAVKVAAPWTVSLSVARPSDGSGDGAFIQFHFLVDGTPSSGTLFLTEDADNSARDWYHYKVVGQQNGANYDLLIWRNGTARPTITSAGTLGNLTAVVGLTPNGAVGIAHIAVFNGTNIDAQVHSDALQGYNGELVTERLQRLCDQEGISIVITGSSSAKMGPQRVASLLELLDDCANVDRGFLFEQRAAVGLAYRTNMSRYSQ